MRPILFMFVGFLCVSSCIANSSILNGLDISPSKNGVFVTKGECLINGKRIVVKNDTNLKVDFAEAVSIADEPTILSVCIPQDYWGGTRLKGPDGFDTNARDAYNPNTVVLRRKPYGKPLVINEDFRVSDDFGMLGLTEKAAALEGETLYVSYSYSLLRIDSVEVTQQGEVIIKKGKSDVSTPAAPPVIKQNLRLANIYIPYRSTSVEMDEIYPILESAEEAKTLSKPGLIPETMKKLKSGKKVKIVTWGDSVTAGGNASSVDAAYPMTFINMLKEKYPNAELENISVGASGSRNWLYPDKFYFNDKCDFNRIINAKPDLVTIEFVNDAPMTYEEFKFTYDDIMSRLKALNAECILITPHFTAPYLMPQTEMRGKENRPYVKWLREYAKEHNIALADASARWEHLWKEGIPYITLLDNSINHPNDYGHKMFAEELIKCF